MKYVNALLCGLCLVLSGPIHADEAPTTLVALHIEPLPVREALKAFSDQTGVQVLLRVDNISVDQLMAPRINGQLTVRAALDRLLRNSGLKYQFVNDRTVRISSALEARPTSAARPSAAISSQPSGDDPPAGEVGGQSSASNNSIASSEGRQTREPKLEEILVTAQKKSERLQDVPVPVTVLDADTLVERGQSRLQDYFATVPGLNTSAAAGGIGGTQTIAIRGITTGDGTNPTVGVTIDDVPYGSSSSLAFGEALIPDVDPSDLAHIEVLRGPQGTLYGASSIGGLIKFVTADPSTQGFSGRVQLLGEDVDHGGTGYGVRGAANVPLSDDFAVRASGFTRVDPGYIENILTGQTDVNRVKAYGGLLSGLWSPTDVFSVKVSALVQTTEGDGTTAIDTDGQLHPIYGYLKQARLPGSEGYSARLGLYTLTMKAKLSGFDLTSISGYGDNRYLETLDLSQGFSFFAQQPPFNLPPNLAGASNYNQFETKKFTQEVRLSSSGTRAVDWLAGAFYTHENSPADQTIFANNLSTGAPAGEMIDFSYPTTVTEYALFGDLTVHVGDRFNVQFGARESHIEQVYNETDTGVLVPTFYNGAPSPLVNPRESTTANAFTYLVTPSFKISPDLMLYTRFTSGYRVGGPNVNAVVYQLPPEVAPDKTYNYEVGLKGELFDHMLTLDASAYYIDWRNIQLSLTNATGTAIYGANGGNAKSQGLELSLQARPVRGLVIAATAALSDAELTQDLPPSSTAFGVAGDRLPFSSRFAGTVSIDQEVTLKGALMGFVGGSLIYVGARDGNFSTTAHVAGVVSPAYPRLIFPGYARTDLRVGLRYESWSANLFANNAFDRRGVTSGGVSSAQSPFYAVYIQPMTIGLSVTKTF